MNSLNNNIKIIKILLKCLKMYVNGLNQKYDINEYIILIFI